ncbi:hypothetical protein DFS33DRAFT_1271960 [Desarmillaria ectypa]|nr:hypothetical protein DFS33DRAFT_1271960 [Desarmillaria ectypa]
MPQNGQASTLPLELFKCPSQEGDDLVAAAARYPDFAQLIEDTKRAHAEEITDFDDGLVEKANKALHTLDELKHRTIADIIEKIIIHDDGNASQFTCESAVIAIIAICREVPSPSISSVLQHAGKTFDWTLKTEYLLDDVREVRASQEHEVWQRRELPDNTGDGFIMTGSYEMTVQTLGPTDRSSVVESSLSATDLQRLLGRPLSILPAAPTPPLKRLGAVVPGSHIGEISAKCARMDTSTLLKGWASSRARL